jgi:hypothetical protein
MHCVLRVPPIRCTGVSQLSRPARPVEQWRPQRVLDSTRRKHRNGADRIDVG